MNSRLGGTYCLYFFNLIKRMDFYDAVLKNLIGLRNPNKENRQYIEE